jgi:hypothetical protein
MNCRAPFAVTYSGVNCPTGACVRQFEDRAFVGTTRAAVFGCAGTFPVMTFILKTAVDLEA